MREVIVLISSQHLAAGAKQIAAGANVTTVLGDLEGILRTALRT